MAIKILPRMYKGIKIEQVLEDGLANGYHIPKGYVNATQLLKAASAETGKRRTWHNYFKADSTQEFLQELAKVNNCVILNKSFLMKESKDASIDASTAIEDLQPLCIVIKGGNADEQGIWVHVEVALHLAQWASPKLAVWATKVLRQVIEGNFQALTEEAKQTEQEFRKAWESLREEGKYYRKQETDAIAYYLANNEVSSSYRDWIYVNCTNCVYRGLFGMTAVDIREKLKLLADAELTRDYLTFEALDCIKQIESLASRLILNSSMEPYEAHKEALVRLQFQLIDPIKRDEDDGEERVSSTGLCKED